MASQNASLLYAVTRAEMLRYHEHRGRTFARDLPITTSVQRVENARFKKVMIFLITLLINLSNDLVTFAATCTFNV